MITQNIKYVLWIFLFFLVFILFNAWKNEKQLINELEFNNNSIENDLSSNVKVDINLSNSNNKNICINTDLIDAEIDPITGDFIFLTLKKYPKDVNTIDGVNIFNKSAERYYYVNSGILIKDSKNNNFFEKIDLNKFDYTIKEDDSSIFVTLKYEIFDNVYFYKIYTFKNYSYNIDLDFYIQNNSTNDFYFKQYGFIRYKNTENDSNGLLSSSMNVYKGGALYTYDKPYKKLPFDDLNNKNITNSISGGWTAFLERYFISALIPDSFNEYIYIADKSFDNIYSYKYLNINDIKVISGECVGLNNILFVGPKSNLFLNNLYKGLELTIDYGVFWPIASPIFFLLNFIFSLLKNWGFSIIIITFIIKLMFFNLSSMSYKSIGNIKRIQPRLDFLKNQYKDDKKQFGTALINLYKKEKINPFGGCLPILIQIPVFISLYYVLLESIELRHAPFIFWIKDLSDKDPYYILPVIMSITMFIQQKMNPPIQDEMQAKVMMILPVIFLFLFLKFPSGLIIYWIINNILSILQQWFIVKRYS